ncbi:MAG: ABC transporter substrate-binding protein [Gammaproteobacteria bacterium]|nr:ABC transporter substrate-binding protein [Gammaproteobacteria bacterium]
MKPYTLKLFLLLCISILSACDTLPVTPDQESADETRSVTERQAILTEEAKYLLELAENSDTETEQQNYRVKAAHLFIEAGEIQQAKQQLDILQEQFNNRQVLDGTDANTTQAAILLLSAEIAITEQNLLLANKLIAEIKPITREQQIDFYTLKANIDYLSGDYMLAVNRRVQLDTYIVDEKDKNRNYQKTWAALSNLSSRQLKNQHSDNPVIKGWLDLARVMRSGQHNISQLENDLLDWGTRNPLHPVSNSFLTELINDYQIDVSDKKHIAVILPMQGNLSQVTANITNGLLSAYYNDSNSPIKPAINFYDSSNEELTFNQLYQQAVDDGATHIIGPLDKAVINQLAQQGELDIPVLTLNYSENAFSYTENLFQFGLSPNDEVRQVAELAIKQNKKHAAVFYPDSEWGKRLNKAFTEHYEFLGGTILTASDYATNSNDYKRPIRTLLNLDQSAIRHRKVENTISARTQSELYRRQDIDMIFMAATHHSARGIMPAFKFNHAGDLTVYSTSHVYTGKINRELDRDLNSLIFCDLPWILQNTSPLVKTFKQNWPQQENFTRLFALGVDAYHLIYNLDYLQDKDYAFYAGQTGNIQLDDFNRITRKLLWAQFKNGKPVYFEPVFNTQENDFGDSP